MPIFEYKAMDKKGRIFTGSSDAANLDNLIGILKAQDLFLVESRLRKKEGEDEDAKKLVKIQAPPRPAAPPPPAIAVENVPKRLPRPTDTVPIKDVSIFTNELCIMVRTALPILDALESLARQQHNLIFQAVLFDIAKSVREGRSLSQAFSRYPKIFNEIYISLLTAGETSGHLPEMLERILGYIDFQIELKNKVRAALMYPVIVIFTSLAVVSFLVLFILPTFMDVFSQLGVELPLPTRVLLNISAHARVYWWVYLFGSIAAWQFFLRWLKNPTNVKTFDAFQMRVPIVGPVVKAIAITRILRTLSQLLASGVPILQSLQLAQAAAGNLVYSELFAEVYRSASEGHGLSAALRVSPHFPQQVVNMIANAEKTGTLPEVLNQVSHYYEKETDQTLKNLFSAIEPIFVVFLGLMVGGIAVAILLPIFSMSSKFE